MVLIQIGLLLVAAVCGGQSLTCLQCDGVLQPRFCRRVVDCYDGELCSAMRFVNEFGEQVYNLGCHTRKVCGNLTTSSGAKQCAKCCGTNLCNSEACGELGYPLNRGPVCFNCPSHTSTGLCHDIDFCLEDETCNIVGRQLFSSEVLTSKCVSKHVCRDQTGSHISIIGKREVANVKRTRQQTCDLCCHDDLCNRNCLTASNIPDKDECISNPCGFGGTCFDAMNGYNCMCAPGFSGVNCETDIDDCLIGLCGTYGTCIDGINNYTCACETGFTGNSCEINIDECTSNPCGFGGTCFDALNGYNCVCATGYSGVNCEIDIDDCLIGLCGTHGTCNDKLNGYTCACAPGFTGNSCETKLAATDCTDVLHQSVNPSNGVYNVLTWKTHRTIQVYCDMTTAGGGWTVFQNRFDGSVNFIRNFSEYVNGFGDIHKEFWLGLENLHELVSQGNYELRIDVTAANGSKGFETFPNFTVSAGSNYTLHITPGHGSIGDNVKQGMSYHNGLQFSTFDHDRDNGNVGNCAQVYKSGWWYDNCMTVHLNGVYNSPVLLVLSIVHLFVQKTAALECFSCQAINDVNSCNNTLVCKDGQACFLNTSSTNQHHMNVLGCIGNQQCAAHGNIPATIVGRDLNTRQTTDCLECCSSDHCNKNLCEHLKPQSCIDDESIDCARLNSLFNICNDISQAKKVCPKFCNLCNVVDGNWTPWSVWSSCDVTCEKGLQTRTRSCTNPAPQYGGQMCLGNSTDNKVCELDLCPIHGGWSQWQEWGSCSVTCGMGMKSRSRDCSNPPPSRFGDHCFGHNQESQLCMPKICSNGGWSAWESWGSCSVTCGSGVKSRFRSCTNPKPSPYGQYCKGHHSEIDSCLQITCESLADCSDIKHQNVNALNGVYNVFSWKTHRTIQVYCDMTTAGGGWTVFQNRFDGSVNFTRNFSEYVNGFGDIHKEFWLGLENLHELVSQGNYELRIDVTAANGSKGYETFPNFTISAGSDYTLHISLGHGSIGDNAIQGMSNHNGMPFSTFDHDRDHLNGNCAQSWKSGWWYNNCMFVHLNGVYFSPGTTTYTSAMSYFMFTQDFISLKTSRMMFRKV